MFKAPLHGSEAMRIEYKNVGEMLYKSTDGIFWAHWATYQSREIAMKVSFTLNALACKGNDENNSVHPIHYAG